MLGVYWIDHSLYCAKLRLGLRAKGLEFEHLAPPGGVGSPENLSIVPSGNLPALVDGDLVLTDSEAILEYLEEKHPEPALLPAGLQARAKTRELARFHDTRLEPALRRFFPLVAPANRDVDAVVRAGAECAKRLKALDVMLHDHPPPTGRLSMGDLGLIVSLAWLDMLQDHGVFDLKWPENVRTYWEGRLVLPVVAEEMTFYRPFMTHWISTKTEQ